MSGISGKKKEKAFEGFVKYVGFFKGKVVAINPDREDLNKLQGKESSEEDKEIEYTGEKEGVRTTRVTFWLEAEGKEGVYIPYTILLKEEPWRNKAGDKIQLVNQVGDSTWVEANEDNEFSKDELFENFTNFTNVKSWKLPSGEIVEKWKKGAKPEEVELLGDKEFRPAVVGESELLDFLKTWLNIELKDSGANLLLDTNKLFGGNVKELTSQIDGDFARPFVALAYVRVDDEDPDKQYQKVFRKFLPANFMKFINNGCKMPNAFSEDKWADFMKELEGDYGPEGLYVLEPLKEYNPNDDFATSKETRPDVTATNNKY